MARRDAGHVAEPTRGQAQQHRVLVVPRAGHVHERRRGQLRHVAHHRDQRVVQFGRDRDRLGAEARHPRTHLGEHLRIGAPGRREHPGGADEQVGAGAGQALLLRAGHRDARRRSAARASGRAASTAATTGAFTEPTSVTSAAPASSASITTSATWPTGTATTVRSAPATASATLGRERVDRAELERRRGPRRVVVEPAHRRRRRGAARARSSHR